MNELDDRASGRSKGQAIAYLLTTAVGSVLLLLLLMLGGGDPYGELVGVWSIPVLPLAALLVMTEFVVRHVVRMKNRIVSESASEND